jgi:hypothetical protein
MDSKYTTVPSIKENKDNLWNIRQQNINKHGQQLIDYIDNKLKIALEKSSNNWYYFNVEKINRIFEGKYKFDRITIVSILQEHYPKNYHISAGYTKDTEYVRIIINPPIIKKEKERKCSIV